MGKTYERDLSERLEAISKIADPVILIPTKSGEESIYIKLKKTGFFVAVSTPL